MIIILDALYILANPKNKQTLIHDRDTFYFSNIWKKKRKEILIRDNYECQTCKDKGKVTINTKLIVHHIKPFEFYPELKLEDDNLLTVCLTCHNKIHFGVKTQWDDEWW